MFGRSLAIAAVLALAGAGWGSFAGAQDTSRGANTKVFQQIEQADKQAKEDGLVLENFAVEQPPNDPRLKSMKLSIGGLGEKPASAFDDRPSNFLLDPEAPPEAPPFGFNLKLKF